MKNKLKTWLNYMTIVVLFINTVEAQNKLLQNDSSFLQKDSINNTFQNSRSSNDPLQIYTPNVYALAKYGDVPVDYSSGTPNIGIPLMSISDKDISVDVSLSYHATGIKVDQEATWVGLGWVLNAGGIITRKIRGRPDAYDVSGKFNYRPDIPDYDYTKPITQYFNEVSLNLSGIANISSYDGEPDIFYYNFCGKTGKFILDNDAKACFFKYEDFKVEFIVDNKFVITDNLGIKYEFSPDNYFYYNNILTNGCWYLKKITSPSGGEINFAYNNNNSYNSRYRMYSSYFLEILPQTPNVIDYYTYHGSMLSNTIINDVLLSKITTKSGSYINFNPSTSVRLDVDNYTTTKALEEIVMYDNNDQMQKKKQLEYSYFEANQYRRYKNVNNQSPPEYNCLNYRLRLDKVKEISVTGGIGDTYSFEYSGNNNPAIDDPYTLPYRLSPCQDHWGYYNFSYNETIFPNNSGNKSIIPDKCFSSLFYVYFGGLTPLQPSIGSYVVTGGANRDPDPEAVKAGSLKKIIYPTGGYSQFDFEPHNQLGGGIRIKQIELNDGNKTITKKYSYEPFWSSLFHENYNNPSISYHHKLLYNPFSQVDTYNLPLILISMGVPYNMAYKQYLNVIKIDAGHQLDLNMEMAPVYQKVTESITGDGRIEYQYSCTDNYFDNSNINDNNIQNAFLCGIMFTDPINRFYHSASIDFNTYPYPDVISNDWKNRLLVNKRIYKEDGSMIAEDSIYYKIETLHALPSYKVYQFSEYNYLYSRSYTIGGLVKPNKEVTRQYNTGQGVIRSVKEYEYMSAHHKQPTKETTTNSDGSAISTMYYYPPDYSQSISEMSTLKTKNILLSVDIRNYSIKNNISKLITGKQTKYNVFGQPLNIYMAEPSASQTDIAFNILNPYTFSQKASLVYHTDLNLQTFTPESGATIFYIWGYKGQRPIAKIEYTTYAQVTAIINITELNTISDKKEPTSTDWDTINNLRSTLPETMITTYTYKPLVGITSETNPSGRTIYYDYDNFGRLKESYIKEINVKKILNKYEYNIKNQ